MPHYFLKSGQRLRLRPDSAVGKGGEADVFLDKGRAVKIFKPPTHADLAGNPQEQAASKERLAEHQHKLPTFPRGLPSRVVAPRELVYDAKNRIAGYCMDHVAGAEVLYHYGERSFRDAGVSDDTVVSVLADLHRTVQAVHDAQVIIGDFNDMNVLVKQTAAFLIDADSMQWGSWKTRVFTARFVDPLLCDPHAKSLMLAKPHTEHSDWYAYAVMLMRLLLFVEPFGGVYMPKDPKKRVVHTQRPLKRITVFDPEVRYPKPARPYHILPDDLLDFFEQTFAKDMRKVPPYSLVENLRFATCTKCGTVHARGTCPSCITITPPMRKEVHAGRISAFKEFTTFGVILYATIDGDTLRYLYHRDGVYVRENDVRVLSGALDPHIRYRISGSRTVMGRGERALLLEGDVPEQFATDAHNLLSLFDANRKHVFYVHAGGLWRVSNLGVQYPERWGDVLARQTLFWVGEKFGFGFYRAGELCRFFVFNTTHAGINDSVNLPPLSGQLVDATCCFGKDRIWFFVATSEGGQTVHRCHVLDGRGTYLASADAIAGDGSWLQTLRGKCAANDFLLSATDNGVVRVEVGNGVAVTKEFPATTEFVDSDSRILLGSKGLYTIRKNEIWRLVLK